ncbi:MAG: putative type secretion system protein [Pedosphaera sp.]|nr:putative type secretion system protein [Pedosphaera sp.]
MKLIRKLIGSVTLTGGLLLGTLGRAADDPAATTNAPAQTVNVSDQDINPAVDFAPDKGLRMNFRGVSLDMVLTYMSKAAGFIIQLKPNVDIKGNVNVWSDEPLSKEEAVLLLKRVLNENGYTAIQDGRTLTILKLEEARRSDIPVRKGGDPADIPRNTDMVTQILPVRFLNVIQLPKDLAPLLPPNTALTANESGSSLIMTDTQANIRRIAEIIQALDSVGSSANTIKVFSLKYADAKTLAGLIKELFPAPDTTRPGGGGNGGNNPGRFRGGGGNGNGGGNGGNFANIAAMFAGGGFGANPQAGDAGGQGGESNSGHTPATRVAAVADDRGNSLVISAPDNLMPTIDHLVDSMDINVQDVTEMRVFHLQNADPTETCDLLAGLFPDETSNNDPLRSASQFAFAGMRAGPFGAAVTPVRQGGNGNASGDQSDRMKRMGRVTAMPDRRTGCVIVCAARDLMPQIDAMINQLDSNPANRQHVYVYTLKNSDPLDVQQILQDLFPAANNSRNNGVNSLQNNPLAARMQNAAQQQQSTSNGNGLGNGNANGFGGNGGGGGRGF